MSNVEVLPTWSVQNAEGRARTATIIAQVRRDGDLPAFRKEAEAVLEMSDGVVAGFRAKMADTVK